MRERERKLEERQRSARKRAGLEVSASVKRREGSEKNTRKRRSEKSNTHDTAKKYEVCFWKVLSYFESVRKPVPA